MTNKQGASQSATNVKTKTTEKQKETALHKLLDAQPSRKSSDSARSLILVEVSEIDVKLNDLILRSLAPATGDSDQLLDEGGTLGSFQLRARLAYRMGLISLDFYDVLKRLATIRNKCAHSPEREDFFAKPEVVSHVNFIYPRTNPEFRDKEKTVEEKFQFICRLVVAILNANIEFAPQHLSRDTEIMFNK